MFYFKDFLFLSLPSTMFLQQFLTLKFKTQSEMKKLIFVGLSSGYFWTVMVCHYFDAIYKSNL